MNGKSVGLAQFRTLRTDTWWVQPLLVVVGLGGFAIYSTWAALQNAHYYSAPYLSPFYSPCISANCEHTTIPLIGSWWNLSPAFLILWIPGGFRATCYYYRKAYYRSFFLSPPACAVKDAPESYAGETRFPFLFQNLHRYFFYLISADPGFSVVGMQFWHLDFLTGFGMGVGTIVLSASMPLCCRFLVFPVTPAGMSAAGISRFLPPRSPVNTSCGAWSSRLNERHMEYAWVSLIWVGLTDLYVRLLSMGVIHDPEVFLMADEKVRNP